MPQSAYLRVDGEDNWYYYYDRSSNDGLFLHFLTDGNYNLVSRGTGAPFLLFNDQDARNDFNQYVLANSTELKNIEPTFWGQHVLKRMTQTENESVIDPLFLDRIHQLYQAWILKNI